jgi:hypothetical protein
MSTVPAVDVPPGTFGVPSPKRTFAAIFIGSQQASHEAEREANPRGYSRRSCFVLDLEHPLRRAAIALVTSAWFDRLILVIIIANCVQIAIAGPSSVRTADARQLAAYAGRLTRAPAHARARAPRGRRAGPPRHL